MILNNCKVLLTYLTLMIQLIHAFASSNSGTCPTLTSTSSTSVQCKLNNGNLPDCNNPVVGTIAVLSCNPWFEHPSLGNNPTRLCKGGRWDLPIHQCYPTCGLKTSKGVINIINGTNVMAYGDYPWQIGVYKSKDKEFICGGSIIEPHTILSAAHCFTDNNGNIQPIDDYIIAAGKYYRRFDDKRDQLAQYSEILKIYTPERFKAHYNLFTSDIAIVILKDSFTFSEVVQPVCINLKEERQQLLDSTAIVTGWGHTEEGRNLSEELKELIVPLVPFNQCFNQVSPSFRKYITDDKICAGYKSKGTSICQGDSGGALVYKNAADGRHYVIGIVSTSPASKVLTCDSNEYGAYTSVAHHYQFVRNSLSQHQPYESVECTRAQCSYGYIENKINCNSFNNFCNATSKNCEIPPSPPHTLYKILGKTETNYKPGNFATEFSVLEIKCHKGYNLSASASSISTCINGIWNQSLTACLDDTCPSLISTETTVVTCSYNNMPLVNCTNPVSGTTALLSCNPLYEEPNIQRNPVRVCRKNRWNPPITQCYPACGVKHPKRTPEIVGGREVSAEDYPWHTAIYSSATKEYRCSGSIIDQNIVITAAHCVTDLQGNVKPPGNFVVTSGKIYSKYDEIKDQSAQYANISAIHVQERFRGNTYSFALDLAVLILSHPLTLSKAVQPVCIELNEESQRFHLSSNINGVVTRWGVTQEEELSDVLKEMIIQHVPFNKCYNELPSNFKRFLTEDSICGSNINNETSMCSGDGGGGLFFKDIFSDRYFIKGISTLSSTNKCDPNRYDLYTLVEYHTNFLQNLVALNQPRTSIVCIDRDCTNKENQTENNEETISENCQIPSNPLYGKYSILGESEESYTPAKIAKEFSILQVSCHKGYAVKPIGSKIATCINGKWNQPPMTCIRTCPSLRSTESTTVKCSYNNIPLENCINPIKGTIAVLSCNAMYEEPNIKRNPIRVCKESRWDSHITDCNPICGIKRPQGSALIVNGQDVTAGDYPWHTGIYKSDTMQFLCGGIIIEQNIILTAAHCVTDVDGAIYPVANYLIAAGKYFSEYDDKKDQLAQYAKISAIHVPERFKSASNQHGLDIAILILEKPFKLTTAVQPVCIELNGKSEYINLSPSDRGVVAGWGFTEPGEKLSDVLKELTIPYVPFAKCFNELPSTFRKYLTQDKFCGGYLNNGTSICTGDSGGGLVFKNTLRDRYFVKGIASTSPATPELTCDPNQYSVYTSVDHHIKFIRNHLAVNQLRMGVECVGDDCAHEENQTGKNEKFNNSENCAIPLLLYTNYKILGEYETSYKPGDFVKQFSILEISCRKGYTLSPFAQNTSYCLNGKWNELPAPCLSTCPSLISTETTRIACTYNNIPLENCTNPVNGTKALLSCNPLYEEPTIQRNPIRLCKKNVWEPSATFCYPICGISYRRGNSDIVKAGNADEDFSWNVGIYTSTTKKFICSGTIIHVNIILTAAQCVTDDDGIVLPAGDHSVAAGKKFREYYDARDLSVQYSNVLTIYVPEGYKGRSNMFASDIAILILSNPFMLYDGVRPVCVDLNEESRHLQLSPTDDGVTGWGYTHKGGELSVVLREQVVSIVPYNKCSNESAENLRKYITPDKICGVYINNGTTECGDSTGGAFVFQSTLSGRYFVKGILSTSVTQESATCNSNKYNLYTSVDHHIKFMQDIVARHQLN